MSKLLTMLTFLALLLTSGQADALQTRRSDVPAANAEPALRVMQSRGVSLSQAVEQVRRQYKGRIISAETKINGKKEVHVIKVLTQDGKVKTVSVPGKRRA